MPRPSTLLEELLFRLPEVMPLTPDQEAVRELRAQEGMTQSRKDNPKAMMLEDALGATLRGAKDFAKGHFTGEGGLLDDQKKQTWPAILGDALGTVDPVVGGSGLIKGGVGAAAMFPKLEDLLRVLLTRTVPARAAGASPAAVWSAAKAAGTARKGPESLARTMEETRRSLSRELPGKSARRVFELVPNKPKRVKLVQVMGDTAIIEGADGTLRKVSLADANQLLDPVMPAPRSSGVSLK